MSEDLKPLLPFPSLLCNSLPPRRPSNSFIPLSRQPVSSSNTTEAGWHSPSSHLPFHLLVITHLLCSALHTCLPSRTCTGTGNISESWTHRPDVEQLDMVWRKGAVSSVRRGVGVLWAPGWKQDTCERHRAVAAKLHLGIGVP